MRDMERIANHMVLVTGPSGAGRSTAIHHLEDIGFEAIDNLPLSLLPRLLDGAPAKRPTALGLDVRNRDFSVAAVIDLIDDLIRSPDTDINVLYLDCRADILTRRYSETRRRHPLAPAESPEHGIQREMDLLAPIRARADMLIDTSELNVHQLRDEIRRRFCADADAPPGLSLQSFSYKRGLPRGLDMVFDCRFLANPYWEPHLRGCDGREAPVAEYVKADPRFTPFFERIFDLVRLLLPAYAQEGKSHLSIGFGCTGGQHRSVAMAETLGKALAEDGQPVSIRHRELERGLSDKGV